MHEPTPDRVTIAHASDLHLPLPRKVPLTDLANKRLIGWINARLLRQRAHRPEVAAALLRRMGAGRSDLFVITGDLVSLALDVEYRRVDSLLREVMLPPERTLVLPGNHDRYTSGADRGGAFERGLAAWLPQDFSRQAGWPLVTRVGPVSVVAVDTAVWRGPIRAAGRIGRRQAMRLAKLLDTEASAGQHLMLAMHHPPFRLAGSAFHHAQAGMADYLRIVPLMTRHPMTVVCGHLHRLTTRQIGRSRIFCVPSASHTGRDERTQSAYHLFEFDRDGLCAVRAVRHWPDRHGAERFSSADLPLA